MLTKYKTRWRKAKKATCVLLLLENVAYLELDVGVNERTWGIADNATKSCKLVLKFTLLLINNAQTK
jgi:hypothetical protein